ISKEPGKIIDCYLEIDTGNAKPVKVPYRHYNNYKKLEIEKHIKQILADDEIEQSSSEWAAAPHIVPKPDNETRFCVDYIQTNKVIKGDCYVSPSREDIFSM